MKGPSTTQPLAASAEENTPHLRPGYFIVRPESGDVVPLVPADELPYGLIGVSKSLEIEQTIGMLNLGLVRGSGKFYVVSRPAELESTPNTTTIGDVTSLAKGSITESSPKPTNTTRTTIAGTNTCTLPPPSSPSSETTESLPPTLRPICKHWCTHGTCRWTPNCRYQHTMPATMRGLSEVGLSDWPPWYRQQNPWLFPNRTCGCATSCTHHHRGQQNRVLVTEARIRRIVKEFALAEAGRVREERPVKGRKALVLGHLRMGKGAEDLERDVQLDASAWQDEEGGKKRSVKGGGVAQDEQTKKVGKLVDV